MEWYEHLFGILAVIACICPGLVIHWVLTSFLISTNEVRMELYLALTCDLRQEGVFESLDK